MVLGIEVSGIKGNIYISESTPILYQSWAGKGGSEGWCYHLLIEKLRLGTPLRKGRCACICKVHVPPYPPLHRYTVISSCPPPNMLSYGEAIL